MDEAEYINSRAAILGLLSGQRPDRIPCFSGLINITLAGLESVGLHLSEIHADPVKMAVAAATTHRLFGFESAVVPMDMCVEAEALGAKVDYWEAESNHEFPRVAAPLADSSSDLVLQKPVGIDRRARLPVIIESIQLVKQQLGTEIVVGAWLPGPFTLAMQLIDLPTLIGEIAQAPSSLSRVLEQLTDVLAEVALSYHSAGADFVTIHEMGGSPGFIGPPAFQRLILPSLKRLLAALPAPSVLSVCGNTNRSMPLLAEAGADAISVDQTNDIARSREALGPEVVLLGNIDPVGTLADGDEASVRGAVRQAVANGVNAVWPGCDLWPPVSAANMRALVEEAHSHRLRP